MRLLSLCSAALLTVVMLVVGCNTVDPGECWVNSSGGFGGSGTIPIGAGVGQSSGGDFASPHRLPLGEGAPANPCVDNGGDTTQPPVQMWAPKPQPNVVPLTTYRLRAIAAAQGVGAGLTGIQLNRAYGIVFETWVLWMIDPQRPHWTTPISSPQRQQKTGGLPGSVIPEWVTDLTLISVGAVTFPSSEFWEVKAVNGLLMLSTSRWQILGLIDVATLSPAGQSPLPKHPPPVVVFTILGNTTLDPGMLAESTNQGVAIWAQVVFEDPVILNDPDPDLYIGPLGPMNPNVYTTGVPLGSPATGKHAKLLAPTLPPMPVPGDPDPPEVDP
jgi:hypothetical protein